MHAKTAACNVEWKLLVMNDYKNERVAKKISEKINNQKTKMMVIVSKGKLPTSNIDPFSICRKRIKTNSTMCMKCQ